MAINLSGRSGCSFLWDRCSIIWSSYTTPIFIFLSFELACLLAKNAANLPLVLVATAPPDPYADFSSAVGMFFFAFFFFFCWLEALLTWSGAFFFSSRFKSLSCSVIPYVSSFGVSDRTSLFSSFSPRDLWGTSRLPASANCASNYESTFFDCEAASCFCIWTKE